VWLNVSDETLDGSLARLAARLDRASRSAGYPGEDRPFAAHVTLARARRGARVAAPPVESVGDLGTFVADRVVLYRSELGPSGSRYHVESSYALSGDEGM
jgi:2'-5' RNA ligase